MKKKTHKNRIQLDSLGSERRQAQHLQYQSNSIAQPRMLARSRCEERRVPLYITKEA